MSFSGGGIALGPGEGNTVQVPGHPLTYKAMKEDTDGAYSLLEAIITGWGPTTTYPQSRGRGILCSGGGG